MTKKTQSKDIRKIWIVDAFAEKPFTGNPAAVMLVDEFPNNMQEIAAEMNLSETAFVKSLSTDSFHIRWFTPKIEVKLCGHATLASAHILFSQNLIQSEQIHFDSLSGTLKVKKENDFFTLDFPLQKISHKLDHQKFIDGFGFSDEIEEVYSALDDVIIRVKNEKIVRNLNPNFSLLKEVDARGIIVTAGSEKYDFISRFFAPRVGVNEDPVTGSAHCKLADYWQRVLGKKEFIAYQASGRGGTIQIKIVDDRVLLTGKAITTMEGVLYG